MMELTAWPPRLDWPSTRMILRPRRAASSAAEIPEIPAPTTQISPEMRIAGESIDLMEIFVGKLVEASSVMLDGPDLFECTGNCWEWPHLGTDSRRLGELYHHLRPSNLHNEFQYTRRGWQVMKHAAPAFDAQLLKKSDHCQGRQLNLLGACK